MKTYINFGGFYGSVHQDIIDSQIELLELNDDDIDYQKVYNQYASNYIDLVNKQFDTNLKFVKVNSPKYYNFETDVIDIEFSISDVKALIKNIDRDEFIEFVNENTKSYDGFISFINGFEDVKKDLKLLVTFLIDYYYAYIEGIDEDSNYLCELVEDIELIGV